MAKKKILELALTLMRDQIFLSTNPSVRCILMIWHAVDNLKKEEKFDTIV